MSLAHYNGDLNMAQWLFEEKAADDIWTKANDGDAPMSLACCNDLLHVVQWLFVVGGR